MTTLAIDTATPYLSLGLLSPSDTHHSNHHGEHHGEHQVVVELGRRHAEHTLGLVAELLAQAGVQRPTRLVVGSGPGSYTGLRIGASLALGLAQAWGASVVTVPTLAAIAADVVATGDVAAVSWDARKGQVYSALYGWGEGQPLLLLPIAKRDRVAWQDAVLGHVAAAGIDAATLRWCEDIAPDGLALARLGATLPSGSSTELELLYL
jgi:tRNA threonylcarbamoyladenosine biosynthesis protein TsaB